MRLRAWGWAIVLAALGFAVLAGLRLPSRDGSAARRGAAKNGAAVASDRAPLRDDDIAITSAPSVGGERASHASDTDGRSGMLSGRVMDGAARAVPDAFVRAIALPGDRELPAVTTDARGEFAVRGLAPGRYRLRVFTGRHMAIESRDHRLSPGKSLEGLVLVVNEGLSIEGRVVDDQGAPVVGARVGSSDPSTGVGTSDEAGRFRLAGMASGDVNLFATYPGFAPARQRGVRTGRKDVTLVLESEATLSGRVEPAPAVGSLLVSVCHYDVFFDKELCVARQVVSAEEPGFLFTGLAAGHFELVLGGEGDERGRVPVALGAGQHTELGSVKASSGAVGE